MGQYEKDGPVAPLLFQTNQPSLAYFVTSHGFGHAARATAVMNALLKQNPDIRFTIFTQSPKWFFQDSLPGRFEYESIQTDVGMVQQNPTREDIAASLDALRQFKVNFDQQCGFMAERLLQLKCAAVLCDISPLGVAAAHQAGIPSILIENFTWDWIYSHYHGQAESALKSYGDFMAGIYTTATYRIQTEPVCNPIAADLHTLPVSRPVKTPASETRFRLNIPEKQAMVLITMSNVGADYNFTSALTHLADICFVIPGVSRRTVVRDNLILLPEHSQYYHPDLIHASDAVIGKVGYSTLAEVFHAGVPFGYVPRPVFPESSKLTEFIQSHMAGIEFEEAGFYAGAWIDRVGELIALKRIAREKENGADQIAAFIARQL